MNSPDIFEAKNQFPDKKILFACLTPSPCLISGVLQKNNSLGDLLEKTTPNYQMY